MKRLITYLQLAVVFAALASCLTTEEDQIIDKSDFSGKTFNATVATGSTSQSTYKTLPGIKIQAIFTSDTTGYLRATEGGRLHKMNFKWQVDGDSMSIDLVSGADSKAKIQRHGKEFTLRNRQGEDMRLTP